MRRDKSKEKQGRWVASGGCFDCGGKCPYRVWVEGEKAMRIEPYETFRPCVRGYGYIQRVYSPKRLKTPLKRTGKRGEGKFEAVSWEEALGSVTEALLRIKRDYGPSAIFFVGSSGAPGRLHNAAALSRLLNLLGGHTGRWGSASAEGAYFAAQATYGTVPTAHTRDDIRNAKLALLWGWNPAETVQGSDTTYQLIQAKEMGTRFILVDPRFTDTAALLADEWVPIRPGTDTALLLAMAYVILQEGLQDQTFIDTYTVGYEVFEKYLLGEADGVRKTPSWAEPITGVSASVTQRLAKHYARSQPAALIPGFAPGRTAYGEQFHRAAAVIAAMTGNIGIHGGSPACCEIPQIGRTPGQNINSPSLIPIGSNPVEAEAPPDIGLNPPLRSKYRVNTSDVWEAILRGRQGEFPSDIRLLYVACANPLNQYPNSNKGVEALKTIEFIVVHEQFLTATARFADIVLPVNSHWERMDLMRPWLGGTYFFFADKVIDTLYDSKSDLEICEALAARLGISNYSDKSEAERLKQIVCSCPDTAEVVSDFEAFKKGGIHRFRPIGPLAAFQREIEDPASFPFPTPSGKIEIFSRKLAELGDPDIPPIPTFIPAWEGKQDTLAGAYPLQLVTYHFKTRAHSCFYNVPWLRALEPHRLSINAADAEARGIRENDRIRVFNDRGEIRIRAHVTQRIMPGVVAMGEGAWYLPDEKGIDRGGCANVLTRDRSSPGGALASNSCLVEVRKE